MSAHCLPTHEKPQVAAMTPISIQQSAELDLKSPEWTCSQVLRLIKEYGQRPALWDPDCDDYKNRFRKHEKWLELAAMFDCSRLEVERKMKTLNSQYRRERLKAARMRKAGLPHRVSWYGYKSFTFLNRQFKSRLRKNSPVSEPIKQEMQDDGVGNAVSELLSLQRTSAQEHRVQDEDEIKDAEAAQKVGGRDEWTVFGELVTHVFRKLPDERTKCIVKHKINTVLFEAEIASYDQKTK